jgi:N-methylhydantoinase A
VSSIGEGGGSIAWIDAQGVLKVGPESAGARPGPACYGRGGTRATITDAFAALGLVGLSDMGYSAVTIDAGKARTVVGELAGKLGRTTEETAEAIIRIAVSGMYADISALVSRFGVDPREFSCLAFGGAGPMLACLLARELGMRETVVPTTPGVLSALGGLIADIKSDFIKTLYADLAPAAGATIRSEFETLKAKALDWLHQDQGYSGPHSLVYSAEMRYRGQSFELDTVLDAAAIAAGDTKAMAAAFHAEHQRVYGHADPAAAVQVISLRLIITGKTAKPEFPRHALVNGAATPARHADVWIGGARRTIAVFRRGDLVPGQTFTGPAVVTQDDCTTVVPPGMAARVDEYANLRIAEAIP